MQRSTRPNLAASTFYWFLLSLVLPTYYGVLGMVHAFSSEYIVQDDVRQHIFWMQRFLDPDLFPNDIIADYFQSIAPPGYQALYAAIARWGIPPLLLAKLLPFFLGLIASGYFFWIALRLFPLPFGAFVCSTIFTQSLWLEDDIITATGRAFLYPLLTAFIYYLLKRSLLPCLLTLALQALFFPMMALVQVGILTVRLVKRQQGRLTLTHQRFDLLVWLLGICLTLGLLLLFQRDLAAFQPVPTAEQMRAMPEFNPGGRIVYFASNPLRFWWMGDAGLSPVIYPPIALLSFLFPIFYWYPQILRFCETQLKVVPASVWSGAIALEPKLEWLFPLHKQLTPQIRILLDMLIASLSLFVMAHLLLAKLYFPSRYTKHSLRFMMTMTTGILLTLLLQAGWRWLRQQRWGQLRVWQKLVVGLAVFNLVGTIVVPMVPWLVLSAQNFKTGASPELYRYLAQQPKDTLIASLTEEADNLPTFSARSVLVSREHAIPIHLGYYNPIRERSIDLITAQYSPDPTVVQSFIQKYGINFFLIHGDAFTVEALTSNRWLKLFQPAIEEAIATLKRQQTPVLANLMQPCTVLHTNRLYLVNATCVVAHLDHDSTLR